MTVVVVLVVVAALLGAVAATAGVASSRDPASRRVVVVGALVAAILVAGVAVVFVMVRARAGLAAADVPVLQWAVAHRNPGTTVTARVVSTVGGTLPTGGLAVVSAAVLALCRRRRRAVVWVGGVVVGAVLIRGLKDVVERPRPPLETRVAVETSPSFPSGHSLMAALGLALTVAAVVTLTAGRGAPGRTSALVSRTLTVVLGAVLTVAIGGSRVYLGVHWVTDVVAGWLTGAAIAACCVALAAALECRGATSPDDRAADPRSTAARR